MRTRFISLILLLPVASNGWTTSASSQSSTTPTTTTTTTTRRDLLLLSPLITTASSSLLLLSTATTTPAQAAQVRSNKAPVHHRNNDEDTSSGSLLQLQNYAYYSDTWTGTALKLLDLETACSLPQWNMARWPDPLLRRPAEAVHQEWFGSTKLQAAARLLQETAVRHGAVGLAAQQCGVNARMVYLEKPHRLVMVNPYIIHRSPEVDMLVWREECLVLPPSFRATVLRDEWVDVAYQDWRGGGEPRVVRLRNEAARAAQHELDHDRGILILDHVGLEEMENNVMRAIEREGHDERMRLAYARTVVQEDDSDLMGEQRIRMAA